MDVTNPELALANDYVRYTDNNIYLTGKTTFLRQLKESSPKRMIITAPTGVAAINAGGVTLHSFFQMPFGPFILLYPAVMHISRHSIGKSIKKKATLSKVSIYW